MYVAPKVVEYVRVACVVVSYGPRRRSSSVWEDERGGRLSPVLRALREKRPRGCGFQSAGLEAVLQCRIRTSSFLNKENTSLRI